MQCEPLGQHRLILCMQTSRITQALLQIDLQCEVLECMQSYETYMFITAISSLITIQLYVCKVALAKICRKVWSGKICRISYTKCDSCDANSLI